MGITELWARGDPITQEDVDFFRDYLAAKAQRRQRERKSK